MLICPLCLNQQSFNAVSGPDKRAYHECVKCSLIFTETRFQLDRQQEKERYQEHNNGIQFPGYVQFLSQAIEVAQPFLSKEMKGLDYGCGPNPTLSLLLEQQGYTCKDYDPMFFPDLPEGLFEFIFATECFEHFFYPAKEISKLKEILAPHGFLIVMTEKWKTIQSFSDWHYAKDRTHVSFFHDMTFDYIAERYGFKILETQNERVLIMQNLHSTHL